MQRAIATQTKLESSSAAFRHPRPENRDPLPPYSIHVLASLRRHTAFAFMVALGTFLLGLAYLHLRYGRSYYAESIVYIAPNYPEILPEPLTVQHPEQPYDPFIEQQVHTITRRDILIKALHRLPHGILGNGSDQTVADRLAAALEVERVSNSLEVRIGLHGDDPAHVTDIVNAVTNTYLETAHKEEFYGRDDRLAALRREQDQLEQDLANKEAQQSKLEEELGVASIGGMATNPYNNRIDHLNTDLVTARGKLHEAESQLQALQSGSDAAYSAAMHSEAQDLIANDAGLNSLKMTLNQRRAQLVAAMAGLTETNPARKQDEIELADIDATLAKMTRDALTDAGERLDQRYRTQVLRARDYEAKVAHDLAAAEADAALAAPKFQQAQELTSEIDHDNTRIHFIEDRIVNLKLESNAPGSIHLFSAAQRPEKGETGKEQTLLLILIPLALAAGIGNAIARDTMDETVYSGEDVERTLGLPPVGILFDRNEVSADIENEYAFRIGATLDHARRTANVRTFAFTSVRSEEGTTTVVNLVAAELAQLGNRVLVLDAADLREPVAFIPPDQENPSARSTARTLHPELGMLLNSRGRLLPNVHTVTEAFRRAHGEYDCLLLDCAPLLISADSEYHTRQADATLLIAESGKTRKGDLLRAARLLERLRVPGLAVVLNRLHMDRAEGSLLADIKAYEAYGRRLPYFHPAEVSPLIDATSFQSPEIQSERANPAERSTFEDD